MEGAAGDVHDRLQRVDPLTGHHGVIRNRYSRRFRLCHPQGEVNLRAVGQADDGLLLSAILTQPHNVQALAPQRMKTVVNLNLE